MGKLAKKLAKKLKGSYGKLAKKLAHAQSQGQEKKLTECQGQEKKVTELRQSLEKERLEKERAWQELESMRANWKYLVERGVEERLQVLKFVGALEKPVATASQIEPPKNAAARLEAVRKRVMTRQGSSFKRHNGSKMKLRLWNTVMSLLG